jgi:hypothetical protein
MDLRVMAVVEAAITVERLASPAPLKANGRRTIEFELCKWGRFAAPLLAKAVL